MALYGAWQTERFAREEKLRPFGHYVKQNRQADQPTRRQTPREQLAVFQTLAGMGLGVKIERMH